MERDHHKPGSSDDSIKPLDETVDRPLNSSTPDGLRNWVDGYDEALGKVPTGHVPGGTTVEAPAPPGPSEIERLIASHISPHDSKSGDGCGVLPPRLGFHQAIDLWRRTAQAGPIDWSKIEVLVGRYRLLREIGRGGHGVVFLANDPKLDRDVAVKLPLPEILLSEGSRHRFASEGLTAASLDHPHVLKVYDAGEDGLLCYIVSEYCAGPTLQHWLSHRQTPVEPRLAAAIVAMLAEAVEHAHSREILHRDLKPGNVLLQPVGDQKTEPEAKQAVASPEAEVKFAEFPFVPKLADFGIAKCFTELGEKTVTGTVLGTTAYMAPEQVAGQSKDLGPSTDVYGLGAILYELLTRRKLIQSESYAEAVHKIMSVEPSPLRSIQPDVPRDLEAVCMKCLEKAPADRYASAGDLAKDLTNFLDGRPVSVRPAGVFRRLAKAYRRQSRAMKVVLALLVISWCIAATLALFPRLYPNRFDLFDDQRAAAELWLNNLLRLQNNSHVADDMEKLLSRNVPESGETDELGFTWHYLWRLAHPERFVEPLVPVRTIPAHPHDTYFIAYSPDGAKLATAGADGKAHIFDATNGKLLKTLAGHTAGVNWVEFSPDFRPMAVTASEDGTIRLWNTETGEELWKFGEGAGEVVAAAFSPTQPILATGDATGKLTLWDIDAKRPLRSVQAHKGRITALAWSPEGTRIATSSQEQKIWDANTLNLFAKHGSSNVDSAAFSPDGEMLAITAADSAIYLEDVRTGSRRVAFEGFTHHFQSVRFTGDGSNLIAVGDDPDLIFVCNIATRRCWNACPTPLGPLWCVASSPDGIHLATSGRDGKVQIWKQPPGVQWTEAAAPENMPLQFTFAPTGWAAAGLFSSHPHDFDVSAVKPAPQPGEQVRTVLRSWDLMSSSPEMKVDFTEEWLGSFAYSPDAKTVAVGGNSHLFLLDVESGRLKKQVEFPSCGRFRRLAWLANGKTLAGVSGDETDGRRNDWGLDLLDLESGQAKSLARGPRHLLGRSGFSSDGRSIAILHADRIDLFDAVAGAVTGTVPLGGERVCSLAFSPDHSVLAVGTADGEVDFWSLSTNRELTLWNTGTRQPLNGVGFMRDENIVAGFSATGHFVRFWSLDRREPLFALPLPVFMRDEPPLSSDAQAPNHRRGPYQFAVSPGGAWLALVEAGSNERPHERAVYFYDGRTASPSQRSPRVRPVFSSSDEQPIWNR